MTESADPFATMPQEPWHTGKGAKMDHVIQLKCGEVCTYENCKITRTQERFNNQGTKKSLLWYELWLIANNSKNFPRKKSWNSTIPWKKVMSVCLSELGFYLFPHYYLWKSYHVTDLLQSYTMSDEKIFILTKTTEAFTAKYSAKYIF